MKNIYKPLVTKPDAILWDNLTEDRTVKQEDVKFKGKTYFVSTAILGLNHNFSKKGPPILYETMVFKKGSWDDLICLRCSTRQQAEKQHKRVKDFLLGNVKDLELEQMMKGA